MSRPRQVIPGSFLLITRRCTQRQFLLRPDRETNNAFAYCLAEAAERFDIDVLLSVAESNHHHTIIYDRHGRYPLFMEHFHRTLAKCINAYRRRRENLWASDVPCATRLLSSSAVIAKLIYVASNPVKDSLVERATQWPGHNGYRMLLGTRALRAQRPRFFFKTDGHMPAEVTLRLTIPAELGTPDDVITRVRDGVEHIEASHRANRARNGKRVFGRRAILKQSVRNSPASSAPSRRLNPHFAGPRDVRIPALIAYRQFLADYRIARADWISGCVIPRFPAGTYWLARFAPLTHPTVQLRPLF